MRRQTILPAVLMAIVALAAACSRQQAPPASPTAVAPDVSDAAADGSTLKASAPTLQSPINGVQAPAFQPLTLVLANSAPTYTTGVPLSYRFEVINAAGAVVDNALVAGGSGATTSRTVPTTLQDGATYQWRGRAEYQGAFGPWSARASFIAPLNDGFIRGNELYDPLVNGKTVGEIHGDVTFIPGVGLRINNQSSWVSYRLPQTLTAGEFSVLITGIEHQSRGLKTKVVSMSQGLSNMTDNPRRFTIEKRGASEPGSIAWRVIANDGPVETIGSERRFVRFDPALSYFWRAVWAPNSFNLSIDEGGVGGARVYERGKALLGTYDPSPHMVFLGSPESTSGPDAQSVPGMVLRHVWVSPAPRPAYANR